MAQFIADGNMAISSEVRGCGVFTLYQKLAFNYHSQYETT